jgi:hypothetical protein
MLDVHIKITYLMDVCTYQYTFVKIKNSFF